MCYSAKIQFIHHKGKYLEFFFKKHIASLFFKCSINVMWGWGQVRVEESQHSLVFLLWFSNSSATFGVFLYSVFIPPLEWGHISVRWSAVLLSWGWFTAGVQLQKSKTPPEVNIPCVWYSVIIIVPPVCHPALQPILLLLPQISQCVSSVHSFFFFCT